MRTMANRKDNKDGTLCLRIVEVLEEQGPLRTFEIAEWTGCSIKTLVRGGFLNAMMLAGRIHVGQQLSNPGGGAPIKVWAAGEGVNAVYKRVSKQHKLAQRRKYRRLLVERYGTELTNKMIRGRNHGGGLHIVFCGKTVYERRPSA